MAKPAVGGSPAIRALWPAHVWSITGAPPQRRLCATMWCWGLFVGQGLRGSVLGLVIPAAEGEGIAVLDALPELGACGRGLQRDEWGSRRADTNQPPYCGRATGGPNRRPGPNQPGTPAPGGRGTDAPRPPPVRTRFNGTTAPDVGFRARRGTSSVRPPQNPKDLGFRVFSPFALRWCRPFGLKTPASCRTENHDLPVICLQKIRLTDF